MIVLSRRWRGFLAFSAFFLGAVLLLVRRDPALIDRYRPTSAPTPPAEAPPTKAPPLESAGQGHGEGHGQGHGQGGPRLVKLPDRYPVTSFRPLPTEVPAGAVPAMQKEPAPTESEAEREERAARRAAVVAAFDQSWTGYKKAAWLADEVAPLSGQPRQDYNKLGGWAATLVDSLDTLWIMGKQEEFAMAVQACEAIDFGATAADTINVFETTIRYLGGFLSAYELSGGAHPQLLRKAGEVAEVLLGAFDTPNRLPLGRWDWRTYVRGGRQESAPHAMSAAELGSLALEFTKLTQLTGDKRYYDAVARIADVLAFHQWRTQLPGMWPVVVDAATPAFDADATFSLGGKSDSLYELLPKQWLLLGGALDQPRHMYEGFLPVAKKHLFRRVINAWNIPLVLPGDAEVVDDPLTGRAVVHTPHAQHLGCFAGGMVGLAARAFGHGKDDMDLAAQLTDACVWAYNVTASGVGPERLYYASCGSIQQLQAGFFCDYTENKWRDALRKHWKGSKLGKSQANGILSDGDLDQLMRSGRLAPGIVDVDDPRYLLRPEAIESVFVMWRLTGDRAWPEKAWHMFQRVAYQTGDHGHPDAQIAAAALDDVTQDRPNPLDRTDSYWLAETLKYYYLIFADWDVVSLDTWVFSTEAHPLRRAGAPAETKKSLLGSLF